MRRFIALGLAWALLAGCELIGGDSSPDDNQARLLILVNIDDFDFDDWPVGDFTVRTARVDGDILTLQVAFSGCGPAEFDLVSTNLFLESYPVQSGALLSFDAGDCEALVVQTVRFDLTPLKEVYRRDYRREHDVIILFIGYQGEEKARFRYEF